MLISSKLTMVSLSRDWISISEKWQLTTVGYPVKRPKRTVSQFCKGKLDSSKIAPEILWLEDEFPLGARPFFRVYVNVKYISYWKGPGKFVGIFSNLLFQRFNGMSLLFHSPFELAEKAKDMIRGIYTLTMVPSQWMEQKSGHFCTRNLKYPSTDQCFCLAINSNTTYLQTINLKVLIYTDFNSWHEEDKYDDSTFCWSLVLCQNN